MILSRPRFGEAIGGDPAHDAAFFAHIHGSHQAAQVTADLVERGLGHRRHRVVAGHCRAQFGLAGAQPGLVFQQGVMRRLLVHRLGVGTGQADQFAAAKIGQQPGHGQAEKQEYTHRPAGGRFGRHVSLDQQLFFDFQETVELAPHLVGERLAAAALDQGQVIAFVAAQIDHFGGELFPQLLRRLHLAQTGLLRRVVRYFIDQSIELGLDQRQVGLVRRQKLLVLGNEIAAHAGFQLGRHLADLVGVADHPLGMLDPSQYINQVHNDGDEHQGAEHADAKGHGDVSRKDTAELIVIDH